MKVFITGGEGFIGRNLIEFLTPKHEVLHPTHADLDLIKEEAVSEYLKTNRPDVVIHCANIGATRKTDSLPIIVDHNVRMFLNLSKNEQYFGRMIFYGSGAEFDKRENLKTVPDEYETPHIPVTQYGFSKYLCSHFIGHFQKIFNLRIFGIFGKYDDYQNRFVSNAICRAVKNLPIIIYKDQKMSFVSMDDVSSFTETFLTLSAKHKFYNLSTNISTLLGMANLIKNISGKNIPIIIQNPGMAPEYTANSSRLFKETNLKVSEFIGSVKKVYEWYDSHQELIDISKLK